LENPRESITFCLENPNFPAFFVDIIIW
jgi:hypothetical protein